MHKILAILGIILLMTNCGQKLGDYYFDFDSIDHYTIEIDGYQLLDLLDKPNLTKKQEFQIDIIIKDVPNSIVDTLFISEFEENGFEKRKIHKNNLESINNLFREKSHKESSYTSCISIYRDILVFKKKGKAIGIAKICFDCSQNQILGANANTMKFGQSGDYRKLAELLNK